MESHIAQKDEGFEIEIPFNLFKYLSTDNCDINSLCRICLSESNKELFPLISTTDSGLLQDMFTAFTAIHVILNDGLPSQICDICRVNVLTCFEFKNQCIKADYVLKSLLKGDFVTKEDIKEVPIEIERPTTAAKGNIPSEEVKTEEDVAEDAQYLYIVDHLPESDNEANSMVQNTNEIKTGESPIAATVSQPLQKNISVKKSKVKKHKPYDCSFCYKKFRSTKAVKSHVKRIHSDARLEHSCAQCKESFQTDHDLKLHLPVHAAGPLWTCVQCNKGFKGRSMFRRHIQRHMQCKRYSCDCCGKPFTELYALRRHSRVHTGEEVEKRHACHLCDKRYAQSRLLEEHLARHKDLRPYICDVCGNTFPSTRLLQSHHRIHLEDKPHTCTYCNKRFRHESTLRTHSRTHTGERPYVCAACGKRFIQNSNLTLHMRTHTGERPYSCETCGRSFSSGSTLKTHIRTHTGEKPYECPKCGKRFARRTLRAHLLSHAGGGAAGGAAGARPHACAVCARRFPTRARLADHSRVHTGEKPFECAQCSTKFGSKSHLVKHVKTHQIKKKKLVVLHVDPPTYIDKIPETKDTNNKEEKEKVLTDVGIEEVVDCTKGIILDETHDDVHVTEEIIIPSDMSDTQTDTLCLTSEVNTDINYPSNMNVVTFDDSGIRIASSLENTTVKLYQLDQSLVQIHSSGGQVTISKITSKMTANF